MRDWKKTASAQVNVVVHDNIDMDSDDFWPCVRTFVGAEKCVLGQDKLLRFTMIASSLNLLCWKAGGIMSAIPYLNHCLTSYDVSIFGIAEHWLREYNIHSLDSLFANIFDVVANPVLEINPLQYRCSIRGGVAIFYSKAL